MTRIAIAALLLVFAAGLLTGLVLAPAWLLAATLKVLAKVVMR